MNYELLNQPVYFIKLENLTNEVKMYHLSKILFYKSPEFLHFHQDKLNRENSILISQDGIDELIPFLDGSEIKIYECIQISNTMDYINESGFVSLVSTKFSSYNIPIVYITTYKSNFVLFEKEYLNNVVAILS